MNISDYTKRRIVNEYKSLKKDPIPNMEVKCDGNILEWYFLLKGTKNSCYEGGFYIGKIALDKEYPQVGPDLYMLTPSGRFMIDQKICVTATKFHKDEWTPLWTIRNLLVGFESIMMDDTEHGISHIYEPIEKRIEYAKNSLEFNYEKYGDLMEKFSIHK